MNTKTGKPMRLVALVLSLGLFPMEQLILAESRSSNCKQVKGNSIEYLGSTCCTDTGAITNGGILNGRTEYVSTPAFVVTLNPNVVSYNADFTLTTKRGLLKASNVFIYNLVTGLWTAMGHINPDTSTGRFAGATGVLYFNGETIFNANPITYPSDITGKICNDDDDEAGDEDDAR
jgi:hypothetical protein